ncbi:MAG: DUF2723 domain-containing protein [bacterium]|nr:DUF2723 domain-containing protein [bacterium]
MFVLIVMWIGNYGIQSGDGAELGTVARFYGIPHPTGYPLFISIVRLFFLFCQDGQMAVAIFSRLCWIVGLLVLTLPNSIRTLDITKVFFHLSILILLYTWTSKSMSAETAEVYSFLFLFLAIILRIYSQNPLLTSYITGLAISHHWLALGIIPIWLSSLYKIQKARTFKLTVVYLTFFILGLSTWLILFIRADAAIPVSWNAVEGMQNVWAHITGRSYLTTIGWSLSNLKTQSYWIPQIFFPLGILFFILSVVYGYWTYRKYKHQNDDHQRTITVIVEGGSLFVFLLLTLGYPIPDKQGYFLATAAFFGYWSHQAVELISDRLEQKRSFLLISMIVLIVSIVYSSRVIQNQVMDAKLSNDLRNQYTQSFLNALPNGTIVFAGGDHTSFPLIAAELSKGEGKPITILSAKLRKKELNRLLEKYNGGRVDVPDVRLQLGLVYPRPVVIVIDPFSSQHDAVHLAFRVAQLRLNHPDTLRNIELVPRGSVYQLRRNNEPLIPEVQIPKWQKEIPNDPLWSIVEWLNTQKTGKINETAQKIVSKLIEQKRWDLVAEFGIHLRSLQFWELAEWCYRLALQHFPTGSKEQEKLLKAIANIYRDRANLAMAKNNETLALTLFEKSLQLDPYHPQTLKTVGLLYIGRNDYENGIIKLRKYLELQEDPMIRSLLDEGGKIRVKLPSKENQLSQPNVH